MATRNLILTADDFGACDYIDNGIYKAIDNGVVTCVSAFINFKRRSANERGGKYAGSSATLKKLKKKHPHIPIGLHLTINTGTPVSAAHRVPFLVKNSANAGTPFFKSIDVFNTEVYFTPFIVEQIGREVREQLKKFEDVMGEKPNHVSCHFGILFHFKNFLGDILDAGGIGNIPVRNPIMAFQTPNKEGKKKRTELLNAAQFFRRTSQMRVEGIEKAKKWADGVDSAIGLINNGINKKKRLKLLMKNNCAFPDYTVGSLYKRGSDWPSAGLEHYVNRIPGFIPKFYKGNHAQSQPVSEFICHLGDGPVPAQSPSGINLKYFKGRNTELQRLIDSKPLLHSNAVNLVDFSFLRGNRV